MNSLNIQTPRFPLPAPTPIHEQTPLSSIQPGPTPTRNRSSDSAMNNALDSWIAVAEETKRVDRLSSVLGRECWQLMDLCSSSLTPLRTSFLSGYFVYGIRESQQLTPL